MFEGLLKGKSVVITGAGSGVGRASARIFADHGARLILADIQKEWLDETVDLVTKAGGEANGQVCDVTRKVDLWAAVKAAVDAYGRLDIMYNNAGIASPPNETGAPAKFAENTEEQMDRLLAINVRGAMFGCQAALEQFRAQGGGGVIVNTASVAGMIGFGGTLYGSTKGAVVNMTRSLAMEVAKENIRVNAVCPSSMITRFGIGAKGRPPQAMIDRTAQLQPLGRNIEPEDCGNAALFLCSDWAKNLTGVCLPVDGGVYAGR